MTRFAAAAAMATLSMLAENQPQLMRWAQEAQSALMEAAYLQRPFFSSTTKWSAQVEQLVGQLAIRSSLSSDSILLLVGQLKFWDAEVLSRLNLEGTLKLVFVCEGSAAERETRTTQFLDVVPDIARLRRHRRVERFLSVAADANDPRWKPMRDLLLTDDQRDEILAQHSKTERAELERTWSIPGLVEHLAQSAHFSAAPGLLHSYGMASHFAHVDGDAIQVMSERENRSHERVAAIELAHGARLIGDVMAFSFLRTASMLFAKRLDDSPLRQFHARTERIHQELRQAAEAWSNVEYPANGEE